jgi:nucleotidyltransferase/DNA polymerase involved in DNA repair
LIACISIPYFAAAVERRGDNTLASKPLAIGGQPWEAKPVYAFSQEVARMGVQSGMSLRLVQLLSPQSHFMPAAKARYSHVSSEIVDVLTDFSCLIEPQEMWHSLTNPKQHFTRSDQPLPARYCLDLEELPVRESIPFVQEIGKTLRRETNLAPAIGLAESKFTAQVAATLCRPSHALPVSPGDDAQFLSSRSVDFLPLDKETTRRLRLLGIRTLGQLADLPSSTIRAQFGSEMEPHYRLAQGQVQEQLCPYPLSRLETASHQFDAPITHGQVITAVLHRLAADLAQRLQSACLEGCWLRLEIEMEGLANGQVSQPCSLRLRRPTAETSYLAAALDELQAHIPISCGITGLQVTVADLQPAVARQLTLFSQSPLDPTAVSHHMRYTVENLAAKYKTGHFYGPILTERNHPLPERRFRLQRIALPQSHDPALA